jgi:hypothetical protein
MTYVRFGQLEPTFIACLSPRNNVSSLPPGALDARVAAPDDNANVSLRELHALVRREGPLRPERAVRIVRRAARAYAEALATGRRSNPRNQVFSLGVTLFFALTGMAPHEAQRAWGMSVPPPPSAFSPYEVPPMLDAIVRTCLAKQASDRFATPMELVVALGAVALGAARLDHTAPPAERPEPRPLDRSLPRFDESRVGLEVAEAA